MDWYEVKFSVSPEDVDTAAAIINMALPYGMYIEDYSDMEEVAPTVGIVDYYDDELLNKDKSSAVIHIYVNKSDNPFEAINFICERLAASGVKYSEETDECDVDKWAVEWKKYYKPFKIGEKMVIVPSWEEYEPSESDIVLKMDPGMAFGSGTHETTSLCIELLEKYVDSDKTVLDIGTGSGILSITALLLGAKSALGTDIDGKAVSTAAENAELNAVSSRADYRQGDLAECVDGKFDIVCANIVADVIIRLTDNVKDFMAENGIFIMSGIIDSREGDVAAALEAHGFKTNEIRRKNGWCAIVAQPDK